MDNPFFLVKLLDKLQEFIPGLKTMVQTALVEQGNKPVLELAPELGFQKP